MPLRVAPYQQPPIPQIFTVAANANTTSAAVYINSGSNQLNLVSGTWPLGAPGATICVPGAGQSYTTNAAGSAWVANTSYVLGDLVNFNGLMVTPFVANSDSFFKLTDWLAVLGGVTATDLETTIVSVSGGTATLANNASSSVSSGSPSTCWYGLDDTAAFNTAITLATAAGTAADPAQVMVPVGNYQISNVFVPSNVTLVIPIGVVIRPTMPLTHSLFHLSNSDGSLSSHCSITGNWIADFTGVQASSYSGVWSWRGGIGAVYVDAAADWAVSGCQGLNMTGGNVVQVTPTSANVNPLRGSISRIVCTQSSGYGQCGFGAVQIDGATALSISDITSYSIGRALNLEADDHAGVTRIIAGIVASDIQQVGSGAPVNQEALGLAAHANQIYDVTVSGVSGVGGGNGVVISYTAGSAGSIGNFILTGVRVTGGGYGVFVDNNIVVTNGVISNSTFNGCTAINRSNSLPMASAIFTAGLTYKNCTVTNGGNSGFQSVFFDGSQGALAVGTATLDHCTSTGNGNGILTTYGFENNYVQNVSLISCVSATGANQTYDLYLGSGTTTTATSTIAPTTQGSGTLIRK